MSFVGAVGVDFWPALASLMRLTCFGSSEGAAPIFSLSCASLRAPITMVAQSDGQQPVERHLGDGRRSRRQSLQRVGDL